MKISEVKALITEQDVLSIIYDYVDIEGLIIEDVQIKELITIKGRYKKKITIPFEIKLGLGSISGNTINIKVFNVNISKIGIFSSMKNIALKKILSEFKEYGINVDKDIVTLDLNIALKFVPYIYFKLAKINIINGVLEVQAHDLVYSENKPVVLMSKDCEASLADVSKSCELSPPSMKSCVPSPRVKDGYSKVRDKVMHKAPNKYEKIIQYAMFVPDIVALLWRLFRDKRVKPKVKVMVAGVIAYLASPIDILPDFIPLVGKVDDVAIAFFALNAIINEVPREVILQNWQGKENIIILTKEAVSHISKIVGSQNVGILLTFIKKFFKSNQNKDNRTQKF